MMTCLSAIMVGRGVRLGIRVASGVLALMVVAAGGSAVWYRLTYNVWLARRPLLACTGAGGTTSLSAVRRGPGRRPPRSSITRSAQ
jgi:hypothetical protein